MANNQRQQGSRHQSRDPSPYLDENIFSDDYEIDSISVADGFRPTLDAGNIPSSSRQPSRRSSYATSRSRSREPMKVPITKGIISPLSNRNSFSLRHDAQYSDAPRRMPSMSSTIDQDRPSSMISRQSTIARPQSTYNGPSAPSHPYAMYPQNATELVHRASMASSHRPTRERSYHGPHNPQHPYAMYAQNTVEPETDPLVGSTDIASVGFPGLRRDYARRLGPDGEEADDIIGPDGHTEQLPPYTKYPEAGPLPRKPTVMSNVPLSPVPQEMSQDANTASSAHDSLLSPTINTSSREPILPLSANPARRRDKWNEKSKRKTCCGKMPVWLVAIIIIILIGLSATLGGVIGRYLPHSTPKNTQPSSTPSAPDTASTTTSVTTTSGFGEAISLTATPTGPTTAPTGSFHLLVGPASQTSDTCLNANQQMAWLCMAGVGLSFNVYNPFYSAATIQLTAVPRAGLFYGDQTPSISGQVAAPLRGDSENLGSGPALYFNSTYNKQVLLPQTAINPTSTKRDIVDKVNIGKIGDNDTLWSCWWNNTRIDGFIYLDIPAGPNANTPIETPAPPMPTKRSISSRFNKDFADPYTRLVKLREYRTGQEPQPVCLLMQYVNSVLVPAPGPPVQIPLNEQDPLSKKNIVYPGNWRRQEPVNPDDDGPDYRYKDVTAMGFCNCEWIIA